MPTIGWLRAMAPAEPKKPASPTVKMPPSAATSHAPFPEGVGAPPTIGSFRPSMAPVTADPVTVDPTTAAVLDAGSIGSMSRPSEVSS